MSEPVISDGQCIIVLTQELARVIRERDAMIEVVRAAFNYSNACCNGGEDDAEEKLILLEIALGDYENLIGRRGCPDCNN